MTGGVGFDLAQITSVIAADRLEDYFPHLVRVQMLAGIGHFVPFEAPDAFIESISTVL